MKTSTLVYRALDLQGKVTPNLRERKEAFIDYAWQAIEEWPFYDLKEVLNPTEFFAFLPVQRASREQGIAEKYIENHGSDEFVKKCISFGLERLKWYNPNFEPPMHQNGINIDMFYDFPLDERLATTNYEEDVWILRTPPAKVLTTEEAKKRNAELIMNGISELEDLRQGNIVIESVVHEKGRTPLTAKKLWHVARKMEDKRVKRSEITYSEKPYTKVPRPHMSTDQMLRSYTKWEPMFLTQNGHNVRLAKFFIQAFVDLEKANSQALQLIESVPFSMLVPIYTSTQFFKEYFADKFEETTSLSSEDFLNFHLGENPYTDYFLGTFKRITQTQAYKKEEMTMDPERAIPNINPKWFIAPKQRIMSKEKAQRYGLEDEVTIVPFYPTRSIPEFEERIEERLKKQGRTKRKPQPLTEKNQFHIRRRMVNGVREYIRDALQVRMNEKTKHKKVLLEDRLL